MNIQFFDQINESHAATGYHGRTDLPSFHIFTIEDTYPTTRQVMPPYRFNFYQVVLLENSADASLHVNTTPVDDLSDSLTFASPEHVLAWVRGAHQGGFIVYFKEEFLAQYDLLEQFAFFRLTEINLLRVARADKQVLGDHFTRLHAMFHSQHPYRVQMLQAQLSALLYDCRRLYDEQQSTPSESSKHRLAVRFQHFVNQHYLTRKTVEAYADLLGLSPDYLSQIVKAATGKTAHRQIAERVLLEAKRLLSYTNLTVAEIADYLGYTEPTHFGRFFRQYVGLTPLVWRKQHGN